MITFFKILFLLLGTLFVVSKSHGRVNMEASNAATPGEVVFIEIPKEGQSNVLRSVMNLILSSASEKWIDDEYLLKLTKPKIIKIPRIFLGKIKRAKEDEELISEISDLKVATVKFGNSNVSCDYNEECTIEVPILKLKVFFNIKLTKQTKETYFMANSVGISIGNSEILNNTNMKTYSEISDYTPTVKFKIKIISKNKSKLATTLNENFIITEAPKIKIPPNTIKLFLNLTQEEKTLAESNGAIKAINFMYPNLLKSLSDQEKIIKYNQLDFKYKKDENILPKYVEGIGTKLVDLGKFDDFNSYTYFMFLRFIGQEFLFRNTNLIDLVTGIINTKFLPQTMTVLNNLLLSMNDLSQFNISRPQMNIQNMFDYIQNTKATKSLLEKLSNNDEIRTNELNQYFKRFNENSDIKSFQLLDSVYVASKKNILRSTIWEFIEKSKKIINKNISKLKNKINIEIKFAANETKPHNLLLSIDTDKYGDSNMKQKVLTQEKFTSQCDLIAHFSVPALNQWLESQSYDQLYSGCYSFDSAHICSLKSHSRFEETINVVDPPKLYWNANEKKHILKIGNIQTSTNISLFNFTHLIQIIQNPFSISMMIEPNVCNQDLCFNLSIKDINVSMMNDFQLIQFLNLLNLLNTPFVILKTALFQTGLSLWTTIFSNTDSISIPEFNTVEIKSNESIVSVCSQIVKK